MNLLDLALMYNDFDWAKEIFNCKDSEYSSILNKADDTDAELELFNQKGEALESILTQYAVKEKDGVRNFNMHSEFDRNEADLVLVEKPPYNKGDNVKYYVPSETEIIQMRGIVNGYVMGYRDAFSELNKSYSAIFKQNETKKTAPENKAKREKKNTGNLKNKNTTKAE